jgi:hypothetical protein
MAGRKKQAIDVHALSDDMASLLATEIFSTPETTGPLFRAAYLWFVVNLHDLLQALSSESAPFNFVVDGEDVVDLIRRARYALVHSAAAYTRPKDGSAPVTIMIGQSSGYADDIAVELGGIRVLVRRHAVRAYEAAHAELSQR